MVTLKRQRTNNVYLRPRVEILGAFGSGKSTLTANLGGDGISLLTEQHEHNIYWKNPDAVRAVGALAYDLSFLLQHNYLVASSVRNSSARLAICDWSFVTDELWAGMRLSADELGIYRAVKTSLLAQYDKPLGYLYLRVPAETVIRRQRARNRPNESISAEDVEAAVLGLDQMTQTLPPEMVLEVGENPDMQDILSRIEQWAKESR